jgi:LmbE family N-acetylglucosaminyl deacetylase
MLTRDGQLQAHVTILLMLRMMVITAHPDDEAGGFGGTLRLYHDRKVETCVVCLTPGQAARNRGAAKDDHELATIRRREFAESCKILQVSRGIVLDYPDGHLHRQDPYKVVCELTRQIREFRPQVLLTFGPEGAVTAHTDHSMASVFAALAFQWAGHSNRYPDQFEQGLAPHRTQKLYYATTDFTLPDRQPVALPPWTAVIDIGPYRETKIQAFRAHKTQAPLFPLVEARLGRGARKELFHLAASIHPGPMAQETDLFTGVVDE